LKKSKDRRKRKGPFRIGFRVEMGPGISQSASCLVPHEHSREKGSSCGCSHPVTNVSQDRESTIRSDG